MKYFKRVAGCLVLLLILFAGSLSSPSSYSETDFSMDTVISVTAYGRKARQAVALTLNRICEIDVKCSAHNPKSQIYAVNHAPAHTPIPVDEEVFKLLEKAIAFTELTQGNFDITLLPLSTLWGFGTENPCIPEDDALQAAHNLTGADKLILNNKDYTVTKTIDGLQLDLGAIAKGYAAEEAVRILKENGISHAFLDLGGNVAVFGGKPLSWFESLLKRKKSQPFTIGIQHPTAVRGNVIETVQLTDGYIVTSGDYERNFIHNGKLYHHILDPQTGYPADSGQKSVTVIAKSGTEADILSTALFVGDHGLQNR